MNAQVSGTRLENKTLTEVRGNERIRPMRDVIVVRPDPPAWSDVLEIDWRGQALRGTVVAVGPGERPNIHWRGKRDGKDVHTVRRSRAFRKTEVRVGDVVELGGAEIRGYLWTTFLWGGVEHVLATEKDVAGIVNR